MDAVLVAQLIAIPSGFLLGSYNFVFSQNVIPHVYKHPASVSAPLFAKIFNIGATTIAPIAATAIASYAYLAYTGRPDQRRAYVGAAALTFATLPLTAIVMKPGINRLIEIGGSSSLQASPGINAEAEKLLRAWVSQNYFRTSLNLVAGVIGLYTALSR